MRKSSFRRDGKKAAVPKCGPTGVLSMGEIKLINEAVEPVNSSEKSTDISSFSHGLDVMEGWCERSADWIRNKRSAGCGCN